MSDALQGLLDLARSTSRSVRSYALCLELARPDAYFRERKKSSGPSDEKIEPDSHSLFDLSFTPVVPVVPRVLTLHSKPWVRYFGLGPRI